MTTKTTTKVNTKKTAVKEAKTPAKKAPVKSAKAKVPRKATITFTSPARIRQHINTRGVNSEVIAKLKEFTDKNIKITGNKDVLAIKNDEELSKKYLDILRFRPGDVPAKMDTKEKREKWLALQLAEHKKNVAAAIKKDPKLAIFAKDFNLHETRRVITNDMKRFSRGSYFALAAIVDEIVLNILRTAMTVVVNHDKRMLTSAYCVTREMESSPYYPLISNIAPFVETRAKLRLLSEQQEEEESEAQQKGKKGKKVAKAPAKEEEESASEEAVEGDSPPTRTFTHYVGTIAKTLTSNPDKKNPFQHVRMSNDVKVFCSDIIIAILANLGVALGHLMGNAKTINEALIRNAFATILTYNGVDPTTLLARIDDVLAQHSKTKAAKVSKATGDDAEEEEEVDEDSESESE